MLLSYTQSDGKTGCEEKLYAGCFDINGSETVSVLSYPTIYHWIVNGKCSKNRAR